MGNLTFIEKRKLERALGMSGGYVLAFSNRTFSEFFREVAGIDIFGPKYDLESGSKANRMRAFWDVGTDSEILSILEGLDDVWEEYCGSAGEGERAVLLEVVSRLKSAAKGDFHQPGKLTKIEDIQFSVALSFPGSQRTYVERVAKKLRSRLGADHVFYDKDYQAQLARPDLDTLLQRIYRNSSNLVVVFLCADYSDSAWCGLEWRAVRDIIKSKSSNQIMFVRFDDAIVEGSFSIDGYIDASTYDDSAVAEFILQRVLLDQPMEPVVLAHDVVESSELHSENIQNIKDALRMLQRETRFLWLELLETKPTELTCSAEVKRSTITRIGSAVRFLEELGHFGFKSVHVYDMVTTKEPVFRVTLEHISPQLVNLARKLEADEPRAKQQAEQGADGNPH